MKAKLCELDKQIQGLKLVRSRLKQQMEVPTSDDEELSFENLTINESNDEKFIRDDSSTILSENNSDDCELLRTVPTANGVTDVCKRRIVELTAQLKKNNRVKAIMAIARKQVDKRVMELEAELTQCILVRRNDESYCMNSFNCVGVNSVFTVSQSLFINLLLTAVAVLFGLLLYRSTFNFRLRA